MLLLRRGRREHDVQTRILRPLSSNAKLMNAGDVDESINDISVVTESNIDEVLSTVRLPMHDSVASLEGVVNDDDNDVDPLCWSWMRECAGRAFNAVTGVIKTGLCGLVAGYGILDATPSNEETAGVVDTAVDRCGRFAELASKIPVRDLPPDEVLHQDSANQIAVDVARLRGDSTMAEKILQEFVELYPNVGYNQVMLCFCLSCSDHVRVGSLYAYPYSPDHEICSCWGIEQGLSFVSG